jgi:hypothetical protein
MARLKGEQLTERPVRWRNSKDCTDRAICLPIFESRVQLNARQGSLVGSPDPNFTKKRIRIIELVVHDTVSSRSPDSAGSFFAAATGWLGHNPD